jgi:hypothetical protein
MQKISLVLSAAAAVVVTCGTAPAQAAVLTTVPMQGGMVMPMIRYDAAAGRLHAMVPPEVPQLTALLVSHPGDSFDPADPWFDALDPSRQGLAFSRRYGFVMDTMTDPLPAGTAIWIRRASASPELGFYRYSGSAPKAWQPIFGTAGTPAALLWNGMMFHPGITGPPGSTGFTATFEAYLVTTATGEPVLGSATEPMTLSFTDVPDGRPALNIALKVAIAWPAGTTGYVLESAEVATPAIWTVVTNTPVELDGQPAVVLEAEAAHRFYRMRKSP